MQFKPLIGPVLHNTTIMALQMSWNKVCWTTNAVYIVIVSLSKTRVMTMNKYYGGFLHYNINELINFSLENHVHVFCAKCTDIFAHLAFNCFSFNHSKDMLFKIFKNRPWWSPTHPIYPKHYRT